MAERTAVHGLVLAGMAALMVVGPGAGAAEDHGHEILIKDKAFSPAKEVVTVGEALTWVHEDAGAFHTVTSDDGSFDSNPGCAAKKTNRCMREGGVFRHTFGKVGEFRYYSRLHGGPGGRGTSGVVKVVPEGAAER